MLLKHFCTHLEQIELVSSRLAITEKLAKLFSELSASEMAVVPYLLQGRIAPAFTGIEFGLAEKSVVKAAAQAFNLDPKDVSKYVAESGDLGHAISKLRSEYASLIEKDISVLETFEQFVEISKKSGTGSQEFKSQILGSLLSEADALSCRYLARIPLGAMRLGASDITILDALSWMVGGDKKLRPKIEKAYQVRPDLGFIAKNVKQFGVEKMSEITPVVGTPIMMMRAERLSSGVEILEKLGECFIEPKYDGFRLQVHVKRDPFDGVYSERSRTARDKQSSVVSIFTRGMENATHMYPDIVRAAQNEINCEECIFEGEALGYDEANDRFLPFQETIQRKRKHEVEDAVSRIPLKLMTFDLLYIDGKSILDKPLEFRKTELERIIAKDANTIRLSPIQKVGDATKIEKLFDEYVTDGLEGIMAKKLDSIYKPGAREYSWVKLKRSYSAKVNDTLDLVVMGYDFGKGKRASFGIGVALLGVYDKENDKYLSISKMGTGLTDDEWKKLRSMGDEQSLKSKPDYYNVRNEMECDVWISPKIVLEIRSDEISVSKLHTSGFGLRFPRLERFRDDKRPEDATDLSEIERIAK